MSCEPMRGRTRRGAECSETTCRAERRRVARGPERAAGATIWRFLVLLACVACEEIDAGGVPPDEAMDPDPLAVAPIPRERGLDYIHETIVARSCAGQPGLCHNGQFEPNLSTPANMYASLVNRPSLEKERSFRVKAGDPDASVLVDKLLDRNGVLTRMPLGAEPLPADEIALIEEWIRGGAKRSPDDTAPAPMLNNPPASPEIAVYDGGGARLDASGPFKVAAGTKIVLRQSVKDFETLDPDIPFAIFVLSTADGREVVFRPGQTDPHLAIASYDAAGPMGAGDRLNWKYDWTIPANVELRTPSSGAIATVPSAGLKLNVVAAYIDTLPVEKAFATFAVETLLMEVE